MRGPRTLTISASRASLRASDVFDRRAVRIGLVTAAALVVVTVAFAGATPLRFALFSPELDLASHTLGALVCAAVAALSYRAYRQDRGAEGLFQASAFVVLAVANLVNTVVVIVDTHGVFGLHLDNPGQMPLYAWSVAQLVAAGLIAAGAALGQRASRPRPPRTWVVLWLPAAAVVGVTVLLWAVRDSLPVLVAAETLRRLAEASFASAPLRDLSVGLLVLNGAAAVLFLVSAAGYARRDRGTGGIPRPYVVAGLVIAAFAAIHFILYPAIHFGLVSTGDALQIAFYFVLIAGIHAGTSADVLALQAANVRLRVLAASEADRTAFAERARLARELHDGLAQDLWLTKLEFERLTAELGDDAQRVSGQMTRVGDALDSALREAREAVHALRSGFDAGLSLADELPRRLDAFVDRTGHIVDLDLDAAAAAAAAGLPGVIAADVLRIVDEALHNVQKHADATRIRVRVARETDWLVVSVQDNGIGFVPGEATLGHGIAGMRERATLFGGRLDVRSAAGDGSTVSVRVPLTTTTDAASEDG